jgi:hypothetical protein
MAYDSTFTPKGPTVLVGIAPAVQVATANPSEWPTSYRVRCLATAYLSWYTFQDVGAPPPTITVTAPAANVPSPQTIGMSLGGVETFTFPPNAYFQASVAAAFEITPGEGL